MSSAALTASPVFRSWLLWGSLATGLVYGYVRNASLSSSTSAKRAHAEHERQQRHFDAAREEYRRVKAAQAAALSGSSSSFAVVSDPDSPAFDLEKLIAHWEVSADKH
ncbi:F1F0 ATP synthase subunit e, mitochondrial [Sorochytrium milnesiophthora]